MNESEKNKRIELCMEHVSNTKIPAAGIAVTVNAIYNKKSYNATIHDIHNFT